MRLWAVVMDCDACGCGSQAVSAVAQAGLIAAGAVGRLPLLTELRLAGICQACWPEEAGTVHGKALALHALPQLQRLFIGGGGGSCSMTELAQLLGALASVTCLTYLGLC